MKFKMYQMVRVKAMPKGSADEYAAIRGIYKDGTYWISNLNMPFCGSISEIVTADEIERLVP